MSRIEYQNIKRQDLLIGSEEVFIQEFPQDSPHFALISLPQIYWADNSAWDVANLYAYDLFFDKNRNIKTVQTDMMHLNAYASWLESYSDLDWLTFPQRKSDRCLYIFRGELIKERNNQKISPSTAVHRMRAIIKFYRWVQKKNLIDQNTEMWEDKKLKVTAFNKFGFEHTFDVTTTDLAIKLNRNVSNIDLEYGVSPISPDDVISILNFAKKHAPIEIYLMLKLGFYTGMRVGSITDLKVETLDEKNFVYLQDMSMGMITIGNQAHPPVQTKFSKTGNVIIPTDLKDELLEYARSVRRLKRTFNSEFPDHLFLTARGNKYLDNNSQSVNVAIHRLRKQGLKEGVYAFKDFYFHRTRATFATILMRYCLNKMDVASAVSFVKDCCMHSDEKTTMKYVKFIEQNKQLAKISNEYTKAFLGL
ncbi:site-specific integrase [Moraxella osloensis]|uniref:Site-specific integrase n=1 Tax=Faucicola osloensis TaxID=34062 RepID=A0AAD0EY20_FAUOS|nr:site-specific integrase [Moraxella osloensis]ATQ82893.1 site-specific integrase [Moraxella osloensis]ATW85393.1 site-specific integrase [Moraxella osloensis]